MRLRNLRVYRTLWRTRSYRRRVGLRLLAFFGATASIGQVILWSVGLSGGIAVSVSLGILTPIGLIFSLASTLPPGDIKLRHPNVGSLLKISIGNLFDSYESSVVITMNRQFDTSPEWVANASLITQLMSRLGNDSSAAELEGFNRDKDAPIGDILTLHYPDNDYLCLAVTRRSTEYRSTVVVDEIWTALDRLWSHARLYNIPKLTVPIIGSGFARAQVGSTLLLTLLITSYLTASTERRVCDLEVVVHPKDADPELLEFAKSYSELLGYRVVETESVTEAQVG